MNGPYTFTTELVRGDDAFEIEVSYTCTPFVDATYWQPAEGGEVEIESVKWNGHELAGLTEAEDAAIETLCINRASEDMGDDADAAADYLADMADESRMMGRRA